MEFYGREEEQKNNYILNNEMFYDKYINDDFLNVVVPKTFEKISMQYLIRKNKKWLINPINYGFISKSGFNITNDNNYILISLDDIYEEIK